MTQKILYTHKFRVKSITEAISLVSQIADVKCMQRFKYDEDPLHDIVLICDLTHVQLSYLMAMIFDEDNEMISSLTSQKYNSQSYRDDEIAIIFKNCKNIKELSEASKSIGYLVGSGEQLFRSVFTKLLDIRFNEIVKKNRNA